MDWRAQAQDRYRRMMGGMPPPGAPIPPQVPGPYQASQVPAQFGQFGQMGTGPEALHPGFNRAGAMAPGGINAIPQSSPPINQTVAGLTDMEPNPTTNNPGLGMGMMAANMGYGMMNQDQGGYDYRQQDMAQAGMDRMQNLAALMRQRMGY